MKTVIALFLVAVMVQVSQSIKCQKCDSTQGDCNTGLCDGVWCTATVTENKAAGSRSVRKDCASVNPTGTTKEDGCAKDTLPDGSESYRCGCNTADQCNSEANIARMRAMLSNQFSLQPGAAGVPAPFPGAPAPNQPGVGGQPPNGQVPPGLINPNSTFTDVISGQPSPNFPGGANPNQPPPSPGQPLPGQPPQPGSNPGPNGALPQPQPIPGGPAGGQQTVQFPPPNGSQQPFPQGNVPPTSPNQNKPPPRPGHPDTDTGFGGAPNSGLSPNTNTIDAHSLANVNESSRIPGDNHPAPPTNDLSANPSSGQSRAGAVNVKNGQRTCACTEPMCNGGTCKGEACYQMMFSANDVHNQAFAGRQGQIVQTGCSDDPNVLAAGSHQAHRQISDYKFKLNGQDITVPASATYCNDGDYCNGAATIMARSVAVIVGLSLSVALLIRF